MERKLMVEWLGTFSLLATVGGSGQYRTRSFLAGSWQRGKRNKLDIGNGWLKWRAYSSSTIGNECADRHFDVRYFCIWMKMPWDGPAKVLTAVSG